MLTGITTRPSTPQEDAEPWPGGSARPVLDYLTGTLGMTGARARELLKAARTAQAETGPGTLADYPVPGRDAHLLIHYAPGSRAYRFKLTAPGTRAREPPRRRRAAARPGNAGRHPGRRRRQRPAPACQPLRARRQRRGRRRSRSLSGTTWPSMARGGISPCWTATSPATPWSPFRLPGRPRGRRRRKSPPGRSTSSTTTPGTPPEQTWPAPTTGAGCGAVGRDVVCIGEVALAVGRPPAGSRPAAP